MKPKVNCGDRVYVEQDLRHIGRVIAVNYDTTIRVEWKKGMVSDEHLVKKVPRKLSCGCCTGGCMCEKHRYLGAVASVCNFHSVHPDE